MSLFLLMIAQMTIRKILVELQKYPIKIINMTRTFGLGPCVLAGFKYSKGDCVVYMI